MPQPPRHTPEPPARPRGGKTTEQQPESPAEEHGEPCQATDTTRQRAAAAPPHQRRAGDGLGGLLKGSISYDELRARARALRRAGKSLRQIRDALKIGNNDLLNRLVAGEPAPAWTARPRAKDGLRAKARALRREGRTYDEIQLELGVSKSSISLWVRDLPKPEPRYTPQQQRELMSAGLSRHRAAREEERIRSKTSARQEIGQLSDRELFLVGVALYWAEGSKDKSHDRREYLQFVNSDPDVIRIFLRWLTLLEVAESRLHFHLSIHETADVEAAEFFWAEVVGVDSSDFNRTTLKRHNPGTSRKNTGDTYKGCLPVYVAESAELYRRVEGWWTGMAHS